MKNRQENLGCMLGFYLILGVGLVWWSGLLVSRGILLGLAPGIVGLMFFAMPALMRLWLHRSWVWNLGYICWSGLIVLMIGCVVWMIIPEQPTDAIAQGMSLLFGIPIGLGALLIPTTGLIWWNKLQVDK